MDVVINTYRTRCEVPMLSEKDINRFWTKVAITANIEKCWEWRSGLNQNGYGNFKIINKTYSSHRISYLLHKKELPRLQILHECDNRKCVNPSHLKAGTHAENMFDRNNRGRQAKGDNVSYRLYPEIVQKGEGHAMAKLTEKDVLEIRRLYADRISPRRGIHQKELAKRFGVSQILISNIVLNKIWKHI